MFINLDKIKKHAANAGATIAKGIKSMNIQPCDGPSYEYSSNDEDYNEFLKDVGSEKQDYVNIPKPEASESTSDATPKAEKSEEKLKKTIENISDTIFDKFNQIKSSIETNKNSSNAESFEQVYAMINELSENLSQISAVVTSAKETTDAIEKTTASCHAELSFSIEKLGQDISAISGYISETNAKLTDFEQKVTQQSAEFDKMKAEYISLCKSINGLAGDLADVSTNQQMSKNSILALAESFDSLNKRIAIGFVAIGVISALSVIVQIVFNIL